MDMGWYAAVLQGQYHFHYTGHTRCGFQMTEIGLHRSYPKRLVGGPSFRQHICQRFKLDGIAQARTRAVGFYVANCFGCETSGCQGCPDDRLLSRSVRHGQPAASAILVDSGPADYCENRIAALFGIA